MSVFFARLAGKQFEWEGLEWKGTLNRCGSVDCCRELTRMLKFTHASFTILHPSSFFIFETHKHNVSEAINSTDTTLYGHKFCSLRS
jgi:hypothetical protein